MTEQQRYVAAFNDAVESANRTGKIMQLWRELEYGRAVFTVRFAISDTDKRLGIDACGEFIKPGTPKMAVRS